MTLRISNHDLVLQLIPSTQAYFSYMDHTMKPKTSNKPFSLIIRQLNFFAIHRLQDKIWSLFPNSNLLYRLLLLLFWSLFWCLSLLVSSSPQAINTTNDKRLKPANITFFIFFSFYSKIPARTFTCPISNKIPIKIMSKPPIFFSSII